MAAASEDSTRNAGRLARCLLRADSRPSRDRRRIPAGQRFLVGRYFLPVDRAAIGGRYRVGRYFLPVDRAAIGGRYRVGRYFLPVDRAATTSASTPGGPNN